MPQYAMVGSATTAGQAVRTGAALLAAAVVLGAGWFGWDRTRTDDRMTVTLLTAEVGAGIVTGSEVRFNGVPVGEVATIAPRGDGAQRLELKVDGAQLPGLTDSLTVEYAPGNLFGISEIELLRGAGGSALRDGAVVRLLDPARAADHTVATLLDRLAATTGEVLTPELTTTLGQVATNLRAFTPILAALVESSRAVAETQRYQPSYLIARYAGGLRGAPPFLDGMIRLLDQLNKVEYLRDHEPEFSAAIDMVGQDIFAAVGRLGSSAKAGLGGYTTMLTPLLAAVAAAVPNPRGASTDLRELLSRVDGAFTDGPDGPVLNLAVELDLVPVLGAALGQAGVR